MPCRYALVTILVVFTIIGVVGCGESYKDVPAGELIESGWDDYRLGEFKRAIRKFETAVSKTPEGSDQHLQALYGLATIWNLRRPGEDPEEAARLYHRLIDLSPDHDLAAWSMLALARLKHLVPVGQDPDYEEVRQAYQEVIDRFPFHLAGEEAFVYKQATYIQTLEPEDSRRVVEAVEHFIETHPDSGFMSTAYSLLANCYHILDMQEKRLWAVIESLERKEVDPTNPYSDNAWPYWDIATIAEFEVGDFTTARKYYQKLIDEYPTDMRKYPCKLALKRMDELETKIRAELGRETRSSGAGS